MPSVGGCGDVAHEPEVVGRVPQDFTAAHGPVAGNDDVWVECVEFLQDVQPAGYRPGYFSTVLRWISADPEPFSLPEHIDNMLDIVLRGILTVQTRA